MNGSLGRFKLMSIAISPVAGAAVAPSPVICTMMMTAVDDDGNPKDQLSQQQTFTTSDDAARSQFVVGNYYELTFAEFTPGATDATPAPSQAAAT